MSMWEDVQDILLKTAKPMTCAELALELNASGESLSGLLNRQTKRGKLRRQSGCGPRGGYGYSLAVFIGPPGPPAPTVYERLLAED